MALAKASFAYLSGDWDYCIILFHNHSGRLMKPYLGREGKRRFSDYTKNILTQGSSYTKDLCKYVSSDILREKILGDDS